MVKELRTKRKRQAQSRSRQDQPTTALWRHALTLLHVFGLGLVVQYAWSNQGELGIRGFASANKETNRVLDIHTNAVLNVTHQPLSSQQSQSLMIPIQNMSVLRYRACCGLGHRLARQAAAYHAAHRLGFQLDVVWNGCGTNIFHELFRPETSEELAYVNSSNELFIVRNEVPGYGNSRRNNGREEMEAYHDMYLSLKERFRQKPEIDAFVKEHFEGKLVVGIHVRAGNGEGGDFAHKKRGMGATTPQQYTQRAAQHIQRLVQQSGSTLPPVLFVATDTAGYVDLFRTELQGIMQVVEWAQQHEEAGSGVFLGQGQKRVENNECVQRWKDMLFDMVLLSSVDLLVAGQYSSFSQTMPMSIVFGQPSGERKFNTPFCELYKEGVDILCHSDPLEWTKTTGHKNVLKTLNSGDNDGDMWPVFLNSMNASTGRWYWKDKTLGPPNP